MKLKSLEDLPEGKAPVLVRVDFNVPVKDGEVADSFRIEAVLPTLRELLSTGAPLVLISHLGRPKGPDPALSLRPVALRLGELLGESVRFIDAAPDGGEVGRQVGALGPGGIALLENLRFWPGEKAADRGFAASLAGLGRALVQDAFGVLHRRDASTALLPTMMPAFAGRLVEGEVKALEAVRDGSERPFVVVIGGAKIVDKLGLIEKMAERCDRLFVGGALANTFLLARGLEVGGSLVERDQKDAAHDLLTRFASKIRIPKTVVVEGEDGGVRECRASEVRPREAILDVGEETIREWAPELRLASRLFWNGPMGHFEDPRFTRGTVALAREVAASRGMTVVGGGDSLSAVRQAGEASQMTHLSTGGGASLAFLEGERLPGLEPLEKGA